MENFSKSITDQITQTIADAGEISPDQVEESLREMIITVSGWRKIFAQSGNEDDSDKHISASDMLLVGLIGLSFADFILEISQGDASPTVLVGRDARPTGEYIAEIVLLMLLQRNLSVQYISIASSPEITAACQAGISAYVYITASHNPIGHNGFKFGLAGEGVLSRESLNKLETIFHKHRASNLNAVYNIISASWQNQDKEIRRKKQLLVEEQSKHKQKALHLYHQFSNKIIDPNGFAQEKIREYLKNSPMGIVGELNGSARGASIDKNFWEELGLGVELINSQPGHFVHQILPEGKNLSLCRSELAKAHKKNAAFILGYLPDSDGDRGNIVYIDTMQRAQIIDVQTFFALVTLSEAAWLDYCTENCQPTRKGPEAKLAFVVNGPTSLRIDEITRTFGIECRRAEVGEANLLALSNSLRKQGYHVRLTGEGSNGGSIIHPTLIRDPINSISSIIKLMCIRDQDNGQHGLYHRYCKKIGIPYNPKFTLDDIIGSLPKYTTTSASEELAMLQVTSSDHASLKTSYEEIFLANWEDRKEELQQKWGICQFSEVNTEGMNEIIGFGPKFRTGDERGGLKILFLDSENNTLAYTWMRGSGTEAVFRTIVDVRGDRPDLEEYLIRWQRAMIKSADKNLQRSRTR